MLDFLWVERFVIAPAAPPAAPPPAHAVEVEPTLMYLDHWRGTREVRACHLAQLCTGTLHIRTAYGPCAVMTSIMRHTRAQCLIIESPHWVAHATSAAEVFDPCTTLAVNRTTCRVIVRAIPKKSP